MRTEKSNQSPTATPANGNSTAASCATCGAAESHSTCPFCGGRGCIAARDLAERLGLRDLLESTEVTAQAVAKAIDGRVLECFEAARKIEQQRCDQVIAAERARLLDNERRLQQERKHQDDELAKARHSIASAEARAKQAEEQLARRRQQPAAVGRAAEKDFAAIIGELPDFRISAKLAKAGDYEVWLKADSGDGTLAEIGEPALVDVKRDSAALQEVALTRLVRDCRARDRVFGVLVADRLEEVAEIFGSPRLRVQDGITVLLTSVDAFASDLRLLGPYLRLLFDAKRNGNESLVSALNTSLAELGKLLADIERHATNVAAALDKQASVLRDTVVNGVCARAREVLVNSHERLATDEN